ncbi:MAG TPA: hypothetical protein VER04_10200 [Polyangiaceae bacterium]|nr:hypothetical protein [Polyangiaceae bacterium]
MRFRPLLYAQNLRKGARLTKNLRRTGLLGALLLCGCSGAPESEAADGAAGSANASVCRPPPGISGSPRTIEEAVTLLNALPKPTTLDCFLESLDRPLSAYATSNIISAQPAFSPASPRIFLRIERLLLSVVPEGAGSHLLEFGYLQPGEERSVKAELPLPLTAAVAPSAPYEHVLDKDSSGLLRGGTSCGGCHAAEAPDKSIAFASAFSSLAFRPNPAYRVSLDALNDAQKACDPVAQPERCAMLTALFAHGSVMQAEFPNTMAIFN